MLIGGAIGITPLVPFALTHWNVKLSWSVKESARCLVDELSGVLAGLADKDIRIEQQLNIPEMLACEMDAGWEKVGVVVCGPRSLCDDAMVAIAAAGKLGRKRL